MSPLAYFLRLPWPERLGVLAGGIVIALAFWAVVFLGIVAGGPAT